jgi:pSer/pThr/pTyr-binding forkhead associated (FHA) protein
MTTAERVQALPGTTRGQQSHTAALRSATLEIPFLRLEDTGAVHELAKDVSTVGRGPGVDVSFDDLSVSALHAEIVRRGVHVYVADLGLSRNGTRVNGKPVARRVLVEGDVLSFGASRARIGGLHVLAEDDVSPVRKVEVPDLTSREMDVVRVLCRPAQSPQAFVAPETVNAIAEELVVTQAAVKQHLMKLYAKFRIAEGPDRRARLANEVLSAGVVRSSRPAPVQRNDD